MKQIFLITVIFFSTLFHGQTQIKGTIIDINSKSGISFVNIGIKNKNIGSVCSDRGVFSIHIPEKYLNDSLTFSIIGYEELSIPIRQIIASKKEIFPLKVKSIQLEQVDITSKSLKENKYGIKKTNPTLHFIDASINQNDIFEIAQLIKLKPNPSKFASVNLLINESSADSGTFRVNFYDFDGNKPTKRLIEINIMEKRAITEGWLKFDLKKYNIYLKGEIIVAVEFIPNKNKNPISYEVKLGGTSKSFFRSSSLGQWNTPPHHYRMYVTTLEDTPQNKSEVDTEDNESIPSTRLFSKKVNDTFSLFINIPEDYTKNKNKIYPTVFLLDANVYFDIICSSIKKINQNNKFVEPIIIGIGYKDFITNDSLRNRDYTFPVALQTDSFPISGRAEKFLSFIENELIPFINKKFRTDTTNRTLMGHSLGGYFSLFALQKHQIENITIFKTYVSASPALDYHNHFLYSQFKKIPLNLSQKNKRTLLLTKGSLEDGEDGGLLFNSFTKLLTEPAFENIIVNKIIYHNTDHMGTAIPTFDNGLELIMLPK